MPKRASFRHDSGPDRPAAPGSTAEPGSRTPSSTSSEVTEARSDIFCLISGAENPGVPVAYVVTDSREAPGMVDQTGHAGATTTTTPTRAEVVAFARAVGERRAAYLDADAARRAGHPDVVAVPTFLFRLTLRGGDPWDWVRDAGHDMAFALHAEQSFTHHRPLHAGVPLHVASVVEAVEPTRSGLPRLRRRTEVRSDAGPLGTVVTTLALRVPIA